MTASTFFWRLLLRRLRRATLRLEEGDEQALLRSVEQLGASVEERDFGVAGAIECTTALIRLGTAEAVLTLRSFEGPTLTGDRELIDRIVLTMTKNR
jgi:hypothetical protein